MQSILLQRLEDKYVQEINLQEHHKFGIVCDGAAEISSDDAVPCTTQSLIAFFLYLRRNILKKLENTV